MLAQKGNRVCTIGECDVEKYFDMGYSILEDDGTLIKQSVPDDIVALKEYCKTLVEENATLKNTIETLNAELAKDKTSTTTSEPKKRTKKVESVSE